MSWMIKIEDVSKMYRLGLVNSNTLQDDIKRIWYKWRGKEDPFLKIGEENKRDANGGDYVWALKDINFEVNQGEILGIIGKNGAGKSTLLKLLSKVTKPSTGIIKTRGRIASLLEVGTGFHPELTGRENIFLNGAILGMNKSEIRSKFDEIVDFSGCERYIDTPVKRYSSGMYVRLAFAVAAHLEPEILVVDEVLAVGDAEFQKKAIGKMKDISKGGGRTVLFVSHNMASIRSICNKAILLKNGTLESQGTADEIVNQYLIGNSENIVNEINSNSHTSYGNEFISIKKLAAYPKYAELENEISIEFEILILSTQNKINIIFDLVNLQESIVFGAINTVKKDSKNICISKCHIPGNLLNDGVYYINLYISDENMKLLYVLKEAISFEVKEGKRSYTFYGKINGVIRPQLKWT